MKTVVVMSLWPRFFGQPCIYYSLSKFDILFVFYMCIVSDNVKINENTTTTTTLCWCVAWRCKGLFTAREVTEHQPS